MSHEVDKDPLLPKCYLKHPEPHREGAEWAVDTIRSLNPSWWPRLIQRYDDIFNRVGVFHPSREVNDRRREANLFLLDIKKRFG